MCLSLTSYSPSKNSKARPTCYEKKSTTPSWSKVAIRGILRSINHLKESEREEHLKSAMGLVYNSFPATPMDDYSKCTQFLPHAITTLGHTGRKNLNFRLRWDLQGIVGDVLNAKANYATAMEWYQRALDGYENTLGKDHPSTLATIHNMGLVFSNQGEHGKALEWYQ
jgi:tetratricopeptide (TPR) repeat protein